jgi:prepilin-type N-terminal cleavage/methylation domain-containing protein
MGTVGQPAQVKGFTLIELLIALAIFGMVVGIAGYGYSLFTRHWEGRVGRFEQVQAQYQRLDLVIAALEDTLPYVVRDERGAPGFYFLGREEGLTLVTKSPIFSPGELAVIRVFRERNPDGRWNLMYEEAPLAGIQLRASTQVLPFQHRVQVLADVPDLAFGYYGWESQQMRFEAADAPEAGLKPAWFSEYDGLRTRQHPERIALRLGDTESVVFVPERADVSYRRFVGAE